MRDELLPAINAFEADLAALEQQAAELRNMINRLCVKAGIDPRYGEIVAMPGATSLNQIKPDTFYGKKMQTAARELLEMRKRADQGPAKPKDIFDALRAGGFQFDTKEEATGLISLRSTLRKNSGTFHKLPNGQYGLRSWYPNAKPPKEEDGDAEAGDAVKSARSPQGRAKAKVAAPRKAPSRKRKKEGDADSVARQFVLNLLQDGQVWHLDKIKTRATDAGIRVEEGHSLGRMLYGTLLGLKQRGTTTKHGDEGWSLNKKPAMAA